MTALLQAHVILKHNTFNSRIALQVKPPQQSPIGCLRALGQATNRTTR